MRQRRLKDKLWVAIFAFEDGLVFLAIAATYRGVGAVLELIFTEPIPAELKLVERFMLAALLSMYLASVLMRAWFLLLYEYRQSRSVSLDEDEQGGPSQ